MRRLGVLVLAEPGNGGTYQYTLSMLEAIRYFTNWRITLYTTSKNHYYDALGYPVRKIRASRKDWPGLVIRDWLNIHVTDPFADEDLLLAPTYSPVLLHTRKPFAFTLHDLQEHYFPENFSWLQRFWRKQMNLRLTSRASRVICESGHVQRDIVRLFGTLAEKVMVIPAPPITMLSSEDNPALMEGVRTKYQLPGQYLFYPAQFWPHKNHIRLIDAFARISDEFPAVQLILTGKKRDEYNKVFTHVHRLGLGQKVRHIGFVEQAELGTLYRGALCLVMPSLFESISIPVYEAFQCGTPVCASSAEAVSEQVGDAGLLFDPYSVDAIAGAIRSLLSDVTARDRLAELGRARLKTISQELYAKKLESLLESIQIKARSLT